VLANRQVQCITSSNTKEDLSTKKQYQDFLDFPNIVLLGDPGSGKSYTFEHFSKFEDAELFKARAFSNDADIDVTERCIYIDGLDENRSTGNSDSTINEIIRTIKSFSPSKVRISCRAQDWLGDTDLSLFKRSFEKSGGYVVLQLCDLTDAEQQSMLEILGDNCPTSFIAKASEKSVSSFLVNPQSLLMLHKVVKKNQQWPETKRDLFEQATTILLTEHNPTLLHLLNQQSSISELKNIAGALYSLFLISGINGFSLNRAVSDNHYPYYQDITFLNSEATLEVLKTKAFNRVSSEQVSSTHRTIAEYLSAQWIAKQVKSGLPLNRIYSLIGFENIPSIELRGMYAWLPEFLPERALELIKNDPLTMISGGDISALPSNLLAAVLNEIVSISDNNPWYLSWQQDSENLGKFSTQEIIPEFIRILSNSNTSSRIQSFILKAIANGPALSSEKLLEMLFYIVKSDDHYYTLRSSAYEAIINAFPSQSSRLVNLVRSEFLEQQRECRLSASIISDLYDGYGRPDDIKSLVTNFVGGYGIEEKNNVIGEISVIAYRIAPTHSHEILESLISIPKESINRQKRNFHEIFEIFSNLIIKYYECGDIDYKFLWKTLSIIHVNYNHYNDNSFEKLRDILNNDRHLLLEIFYQAIQTYREDEVIYINFIYHLTSATFGSFTTEQIYEYSMKYMLDEKLSIENRKELFRSAINTFFHINNHTIFEFEKLILLSKKHNYFQEILDIGRSSVIERYSQENKNRIYKEKIKYETERTKWRKGFDDNLDTIKSGKNIGYLELIGNIYYARYKDTDKSPDRLKRLEVEFGYNRLKDCTSSLINFSINKDTALKFLNEYTKMEENRAYYYWYSIIAGLDLAYQFTGKIDTWCNEVIEMAITLNYKLHICDIKDSGSKYSNEHDWLKEIYTTKSTLSLEVIEKLITPSLHRSANSGPLSILLNNDFFIDSSDEILHSLLITNNNIDDYKLIKIITKLLNNIEFHDKLRTFCEESLNNNIHSINIITATLFILSPNRNYNLSKEIIFEISNLFDAVKPIENLIGKQSLSNISIIKLIKYFSNFYHFTESLDSNNGKDIDASNFIVNMINELSTRIKNEDIEALSSVLDVSSMKSYASQVKYALHNQKVLRQQTLYQQPTFQQTLNCLGNKNPVNHQDLLALTVDHLDSLEAELRNDNFNGYKYFWNEEQHKVTDPKPEDAARDVLVKELRIKLTNLGIFVEPEALMANSKRADIILSANGMKLPIEIKRDYHPDVWTACEAQLKELYTILPQANGYGVFLVFWYGEKRGKTNKIKLPPITSKQRPTSAKGMQKMLEALVSSNNRHCIKIKVFDVSP
jgi:hypothetical protein